MVNQYQGWINLNLAACRSKAEIPNYFGAALLQLTLPFASPEGSTARIGILSCGLELVACSLNK